jgi:hypothetical protein
MRKSPLERMSLPHRVSVACIAKTSRGSLVIGTIRNISEDYALVKANGANSFGSGNFGWPSRSKRR